MQQNFMEAVCIAFTKDLFKCTTPTSQIIMEVVEEVVCLTGKDPWWSKTVSLLTTEQSILEVV
jgi:hypothetical protein